MPEAIPIRKPVSVNAREITAPRRAAPELPEAELQALEQRTRWLYAADGLAFSYNR